VANETIYHITERADWEAAQAAGRYVAESLETQGFIHASTSAQLVDTANLLFRGQDGLVILCIDEARLMAPVKREPPLAGAHQDNHGLFPHIYGPLNLNAVARVVELPCREDGLFEMPSGVKE